MTKKFTMHKTILIALMAITTSPVWTQVGIGETEPHEAAELHIKSTSMDKGIIIPVVSSLTPVQKHISTDPKRAAGLMVFNKEDGLYYFWTGTEWQCATPFDAKGESGVVVVTNTTRYPKANLKGSFTATGTNTFTGNGAIPLGGIIMWSGDVGSIPDGWALCDGRVSNGITTPDLRGRFVVGYASDYNSHDGNGAVPKAIRDDKYKDPGNLSVNKGKKQGERGNSNNTYTLEANNLPAHGHNSKSYGAKDGVHNHVYRDSYLAGTIRNTKEEVLQWSDDNSDRLIGFAEPLGDGLKSWIGAGAAFDPDNNGLLTFYRTTYPGGQYATNGSTYGEETIDDVYPDDNAWRDLSEKHGHVSYATSTTTGYSSTSEKVKNTAIDVRPPYYVLAFIMRTH